MRRVTAAAILPQGSGLAENVGSLKMKRFFNVELKSDPAGCFQSAAMQLHQKTIKNTMSHTRTGTHTHTHTRLPQDFILNKLCSSLPVELEPRVQNKRRISCELQINFPN